MSKNINDYNGSNNRGNHTKSGTAPNKVGRVGVLEQGGVSGERDRVHRARDHRTGLMVNSHYTEAANYGPRA